MTITEKIDNITNIPESYRKTELPAPKSVKIELTGRCNFNCAFCARSQRLREQQDMDYEFFKRVAFEMRQSGVEELGLFYLGESFLYPKLSEAVYYAKHVCRYPYVFLTTNGSLATKDKVKQLMDCGLDSLKFSLNYADEKQFVDIAGVKPKLFHKLLENIKGAYEARTEILHENNHKCGLYASYIAYDNEQATKMAELVLDLEPYLDEIYGLPLYNQAAFVSSMEAKIGYKPIAGNVGRIENPREPLPCWAVFTEGHISWDGFLSACCFDHDGTFHMGDLKQLDFMSAWNSDKFQELRKAHLDKCVTGTVCENCVAW